MSRPAITTSTGTPASSCLLSPFLTLAPAPAVTPAATPAATLSTDLRLSLSPTDYVPENEEADGDVEGGRDAEGLGLSSSGLKGKQLFKAAVNAHMIKSNLEKDAAERTRLEKGEFETTTHQQPTPNTI